MASRTRTEALLSRAVDPRRSIPAGCVGTPNATPIHRGLLVQHRGRLLHLRDVVGGANLLILLIGGGVADEGAIAARSVRIDIDGALLPLREDHRVLRQRLELGHFLWRIRLLPHEARRRQLPFLLLRAHGHAAGQNRRRGKSRQNTPNRFAHRQLLRSTTYRGEDGGFDDSHGPTPPLASCPSTFQSRAAKVAPGLAL